MSNITNLTQRINKLLAQVEQQLPQEERLFLVAAGFVKPHLLADSELEQLDMFVEQVKLKIRMVNGRMDLSGLSDLDIVQCRYWCKLGTALEQEDIDAAATYRRYLNEPLESLLARFMAIPESSIPADYQDAPVITREHVIYHLSRINFRHVRSMVERAIKDNRWTGILDDMHMWLETFSATAA